MTGSRVLQIFLPGIKYAVCAPGVRQAWRRLLSVFQLDVFKLAGEVAEWVLQYSTLTVSWLYAARQNKEVANTKQHNITSTLGSIQVFSLFLFSPLSLQIKSGTGEKKH